MCGYFCIGFIDFMFKGKGLLDYNNNIDSLLMNVERTIQYFQ